MRRIGLTGGIACGKSTAAAILKENGIPVIDADAISRSLTAAGGKALPAIRSSFGDEVFFADGTLNRKALAAFVFGNPEKLRLLNAILHPLIFSEMDAQEEQLKKAGATVVAEDIPLLFETGADKRMDLIICISVSREEQIRRLKERDGMSPEEAAARIDSQMPLSEKEAASDIVLNTMVPIEQQRERVSLMAQKWKNEENA